MDKEMNYAFIASSKVVRHKINPKAADILATLIYKYKYWEKEGKLSTINGRLGFYTSYDDIREETTYGKDIIGRELNRLKKAGLIEYRRQGQGKPNIYFVDEAKVLKYIEDHEHEYEDWRLKIRSSKTPVTPMPIMKARNPISGNGKTKVQGVAKAATTKNKNTKNINTNNFTNPINWDSLEELIEDLKCCIDEPDIDREIDNLYSFLTTVIPKFKGFQLSEQDYILMKNISDYNIDAVHIADKIISNAEDIISGIKECRFGNLFIGLKEINDGYDLKYGK